MFSEPIGAQSASLISSSAFSAGCRHQRRELESKLNERIRSLKYSEAVAKRMYQEEKAREFRASWEELQRFLTEELGAKIRE
jgi:hypothetical protein